MSDEAHVLASRISGCSLSEFWTRIDRTSGFVVSTPSTTRRQRAGQCFWRVGRLRGVIVLMSYSTLALAFFNGRDGGASEGRVRAADDGLAVVRRPDEGVGRVLVEMHLGGRHQWSVVIGGHR